MIICLQVVRILMPKWFIKPYLKPGNTSEQVLHKLVDFVVTSNQHGASLNVKNIPEEIKDLFDLTIIDNIGPELKELFKKSISLVDAIDNTIDDFHYPGIVIWIKLMKR